jgi:hypothetical protein
MLLRHYGNIESMVPRAIAAIAAMVRGSRSATVDWRMSAWFLPIKLFPAVAPPVINHKLQNIARRKSPDVLSGAEARFLAMFPIFRCSYSYRSAFRSYWGHDILPGRLAHET